MFLCKVLISKVLTIVITQIHCEKGVVYEH